MANTWGKNFRITTFGESHGKAIGIIIDGCPPKLAIDEHMINQALAERKPGQSPITSARNEPDQCQILSGTFQGKTTGAPIMILIQNHDAKSKDYKHLANVYRPSHADYTYTQKYGIRDYRGGGRSSARETATWVAAGAIAQAWLKLYNIQIQAYVSQIGKVQMKKKYRNICFKNVEKNMVRCPEKKTAEKMLKTIAKAKKNKDTVGGMVTGVIQGTPVGLGEPVFDKFHAVLGQAMLSINAAKGFEYGSGFRAAQMYGSMHNDVFIQKNGQVKTKKNYSGGIQGGITHGEDIYFNVAFKPVATIMQTQQSIDLQGNTTYIPGKGRHDPCIVPRAVPIVKAMAALVTIDFMLYPQKNSHHEAENSTNE